MIESYIEVLDQIIRHLKKPEPVPHASGFQRGHIKQDALAVAMRVSVVSAQRLRSNGTHETIGYEAHNDSLST